MTLLIFGSDIGLANISTRSRARYDVSQGRVNASGRCHAAEQRDELAPFHCPMPPVLRTARHDSPIAG
jgi:hypothetical protein